MITYLLIGLDKVEVPDDNLVLEEGITITMEENGIRKPYKVETIQTIIHRVENMCDPPYREIRLTYAG